MFHKNRRIQTQQLLHPHQESYSEDFPDGPVVKIPHFHCRDAAKIKKSKQTKKKENHILS